MIKKIILNENLLKEGVYDENILKAFFLSGSSGSGKSYVSQNVFGGTGLKVVNSDDIFEYLMIKNDIDFDLDKTPENWNRSQEVREKAKKLTTSRSVNYLKSRLGLIIDGTGRDYDNINNDVKRLKELGYDCYMVFVNTSLEVALERNRARPRKVPNEIATQIWNEVQNNIGKFQNLFSGDNFIIVDNSEPNPDVLRRTTQKVRAILSRPVKNPIGKKWIVDELRIKNRTNNG